MPPLRVLCFGNSLTAGYYHYGIDHHSYAIQLKDRLDTFVSSRTTEATTAVQRADDAVSVDVDGLSGDLVITPPGRFRKRMEQRFETKQYDWVIVLGATNDLGYGVFPIPQIFEALKAAWAIPLSHGAKVLAMTIPECAAVSERLDKKRDELNALILGHQTENLYVFVPVCTFLSCLHPTVFFLLVFCFVFISQLSSEKEEGQS